MDEEKGLRKPVGVERGGAAASTKRVPQRSEDCLSDWTLPPLLAGAPVFMFSGQGSQKPGMGGDPDELNDTRNAQPALCVLSVGIARALMARGVQPAAVLGFSLGQVSALAVSGMLSDEATFALVKARSELMAEAAAAHPGVMSALLKADEDVVAALCEQCAEGEVLVPANFNCPGQIVIAGAQLTWRTSSSRRRASRSSATSPPRRCPPPTRARTSCATSRAPCASMRAWLR